VISNMDQLNQINETIVKGKLHKYHYMLNDYQQHLIVIVKVHIKLTFILSKF